MEGSLVKTRLNHIFRTSVADPQHVGADPDPFFYPNADPDPVFYLDEDSGPTFHFTADPGMDPVPYRSDVNLRSLVLESFHGSILSLYASIVSVFGPPRLLFKPPSAAL
jgi:hypothetical protein